MKRRLTVYLIVVLVLLGAWTTLDYFGIEAMNFAWHLRHGFHAEVADVRMKVPFSYQAESPKGLPELTMTRFAGRVWHGAGSISVDFWKHPSPEARLAAMAMLPKDKQIFTLKKVGERTTMFAGRPGKCIESTPEFDEASLQNQLKDTLDIECSFGDDAEAMFIGTANLKGDFYKIIQSAESVRRKN